MALVVTQHAREKGLPLDSAALLTKGGGQVLSLGKAAVQNILKRHGIDRVLAHEGGRTSRGNLDKMKSYVDFLNGLHRNGIADLSTSSRSTGSVESTTSSPPSRSRSR